MEAFNRRENAILEALANNEAEVSRWEEYKEDNQTASKNMEAFIKNMKVEIMVPIGSKALMPGYLYNTNKVFASHYQGIFSKLTVSKAQEIIKHRLKLAKERLQHLNKEKELFQNKLDIPHFDGAVPDENQQEIIEEYDEEKEKLWKQEHKKRVAQSKQNEKLENNTENTERTHDDIIKMLDELELVEELDEELETFDSDTFDKIVSGEIKLLSEKLEELHEKYKSDKPFEAELSKDYTNNNNIPNTEDFGQRNISENNDSNEDSEDSDYSECEEKYQEIENEIKNLSAKEKLRYFKFKIKEIEKRIKDVKINNVETLNLKLNLEEFKDYFRDRMEMLKDEINKNEEDESKDNEILEKPKRKISIAKQDDVKLIDQNEKVEDVMKMDKPRKDIIVLDDYIYSSTSKTDNNKSKTVPHTEKTLINLKEKNETFNMKTKVINFVHSENIFEYPGYKKNEFEDNADEEIIGSPFEIYKKFLEKSNDEDKEKDLSKKAETGVIKKVRFNVNHIENKGLKKKPVDISVSEVQKNLCQKNNTPNSPQTNEAQKISEREDIKLEKQKKSNIRKEEHQNFVNVVGDIIENPSGNQLKPDPLPEGEFIDAHAPKKCISRFKQMRSEQYSKH